MEENKAIVRRLFVAFNTHNLALLDELVAPDYVDNTFQFRGREGIKRAITRLLNFSPDFHEVIQDLIAEGDQVWVRLKETGTHTGEFRGLAATDKKVTYSAVAIWRIVDGKIVEGWGVYDMLNYYKELGVIEYKGFPDHDSS